DCTAFFARATMSYASKSMVMVLTAMHLLAPRSNGKGFTSPTGAWSSSSARTQPEFAPRAARARTRLIGLWDARHQPHGHHHRRRPALHQVDATERSRLQQGYADGRPRENVRLCVPAA